MVVVAGKGDRLASAAEGQLALDEIPPYLSRAAQQLIDQLFGGKQAVAPVAATTQDNLLRIFFGGVEYDRRVAGSVWVGGSLAGFGFMMDFVAGCRTTSFTSCSFVFPGDLLLVLRYHPLTRDTQLAWGVFGAVGGGVEWNTRNSQATLPFSLVGQLGAEIGWRYVRLSAAAFVGYLPAPGVVRFGLLPTITVALPF
jgi:hypothetical protein